MLSRGGAKFDKQRFKSDVKLFNVRGSATEYDALLMMPLQTNKRVDLKSKGAETMVEGELPMELDFFKYAKSGASKRKAPPESRELREKKRKTRHTNEDGEQSETDSEDDHPEPESPSRKHRVTTKGSRVPDPVDAFESLQIRYGISARLLSNLSDNGYSQPTGIQSYGIPILMEVCL